MRIAIFACLITLFSACQIGQKGYVIEGTLSGYETDSLYFYDELDWLSPNTIKVPVVDGKFRYEGICEKPVRLKIWGDKPSVNEAPPLLGTFLLDNFHYNIEVGFKKLNIQTDNPDQQVYAKLVAIKDKDEAVKAMQEHLSSPGAVTFYYNNKARYDDNIKQVAKSFTGRAKEGLDYTRLSNMVYAKTGTKTGMPARDLTVYGLDGQPAQLLSDDGKATLVYFYQPEGDDHYPYVHIKRAYEKYKGSNINFKGFCMHVRDQKWIMDADYCEIPFPVYGGTDNKVNRIEEHYGVKTSPSILLVNKDGKIVTCLPWYKITGKLDEMIEKTL